MTSFAQSAWGLYLHRFSGERGEGVAPRLWRVAASDERRRGLPLSVFLVGLALILIVAGAGFLYIRQMVTTAAFGYDVTVLERRAEELRAQEAALQLETAELESLQRVEERLPKLNLVPVAGAMYTRPVSDSVLTGQIPVGIARP